MASKLKIIVDYSCDVFCDCECKGHATPDSCFVVELRKGTYCLEFKVDGIVQESLDYSIDTDDQDYLLRINLLKDLLFRKVSIKKKSDILRDNDNESLFNGIVAIKIGDSNEKIEINNCYNHKYLKRTPPKYFDLIFETNADFDDDKNSKYVIQKLIYYDQINKPCKVEVDTTWLHRRYSNYYGFFVVYLGTSIKIFSVKDNLVSDSGTVDSEAGFIYSISKNIALTLKEGKFGIYDIRKNAIICPNKYDELYRVVVDYHAYTDHGFYKTDKYTIGVNGKRGVINLNGDELLPCKYDEANPCSLGYIVKKGKQWGLSRNGEEPSIWYDEIFSSCQTGYGVFYEHIFDEDKDYIEKSNYPGSCLLFFKKENKYGFWNVLGQQSKLLYDEIETDYLFGTSLARLIKTRIGNKKGFIDCYGQEIIPCMYDEIYIARNENRSLALYCDFKLLIGTKIKTKFIADSELEARECGGDDNLPLGQLLMSYLHYHDTRFIASINGRYGVRTVAGKDVISFSYDSIDGLGYGYYIVEKNGLYGILEEGDKVTYPITYDDQESLKKEFGKMIIGYM